MTNYYEVLEISVNTNPNTNTNIDEIKRAYRRLVLKYHPDKVTEQEKTWATAKFQSITEAYNILCNPTSKKLYDETLKFKTESKQYQTNTKTKYTQSKTTNTNTNTNTTNNTNNTNTNESELEEKLKDLCKNLNVEQTAAFEKLKKGRNVFLTAAAGCGKSFLINVFRLWAKTRHLSIAVTSTTGVSAVLINGTTLHSFAGIGLGESSKETLLKTVRNKHMACNRWRYTKILVIDEVSMLSSDILEKINYIAQEIRGDPRPFGGMHVVFVGDFYQLAPVKAEFVFTCVLWNQIVSETIYLTKNMRQLDVNFQELLSRVRIGEITAEDITVLKSRVGAKIITADGIIPTKLFSHKACAESINEENLNKLLKTEKLYVYQAEDRVFSENVISNAERETYLKRIDTICQAQKLVKLCIGAQVMVTYNLDVENGIANGSRAVIIKMIGNIPVIRLMNGTELPVTNAIWEMNIAEGIKCFREQIPLKLCWAITTHKSQGMTLDAAQLDLGSTIFCAGQSYTALSRCKSLEAISIVTLDVSKIYASHLVKDYYNTLATE